MALSLVSREGWKAAPPKRRPRIRKPAMRKGVVLHWNGPPVRLDLGGGSEKLRRREIATVRAIQRFHQKTKSWSDSAYSYMVGQSGTVFEVRGAEWDQFANGDDVVGTNDGADRDFYTIMTLIGEGESPTRAAVESITAIIDHLRSLGAGDRVLPHNAFKRKTCPGPELTALARRLDRAPISTVSERETDVNLTDWNRAFIETADSDTYSAAVELWQRCLKASGFDPGEIDGLVGPKTRSANRAFTASAGEEPSDQPTDAAWRQLLDRLTNPPITSKALEQEIESVTIDLTRLERKLAAARKALASRQRPTAESTSPQPGSTVVAE